jgi:hypothetical protein
MSVLDTLGWPGRGRSLRHRRVSSGAARLTRAGARGRPAPGRNVRAAALAAAARGGARGPSPSPSRKPRCCVSARSLAAGWRLGRPVWAPPAWVGSGACAAGARAAMPPLRRSALRRECPRRRRSRGAEGGLARARARGGRRRRTHGCAVNCLSYFALGRGHPTQCVPSASSPRVRLVRGEGRGVSDQYGVRDAACLISTG